DVCCRCVAFFFQAEDGIRDRNVTGVQTCALPILHFATAGSTHSLSAITIIQNFLYAFGGILGAFSLSFNILAARSFYQEKQRFQDRKSTRLNSSHVSISYAVFCLKKKKTQNDTLI